MVSEKDRNFALAFENGTAAEAAGDAEGEAENPYGYGGFKKKSEKVWWFEKFAVTLQNISALKIVEPCLKKANVSTLK